MYLCWLFSYSCRLGRGLRVVFLGEEKKILFSVDFCVDRYPRYTKFIVFHHFSECSKKHKVSDCVWVKYLLCILLDVRSRVYYFSVMNTNLSFKIEILLFGLLHNLISLLWTIHIVRRKWTLKRRRHVVLVPWAFSWVTFKIVVTVDFFLIDV